MEGENNAAARCALTPEYPVVLWRLLPFATRHTATEGNSLVYLCRWNTDGVSPCGTINAPQEKNLKGRILVNHPAFGADSLAFSQAQVWAWLSAGPQSCQKRGRHGIKLFPSGKSTALYYYFLSCSVI
jgi:hypothetical protein